MSFRTLFIQNAARISVKNGQLIVDTDKAHSVPIEDIDVLLCENRQTIFTTAALTALSESGACVMLCNKEHLPCSVVLPFCTHSRISQVYEKQAAMTQPQKKQLWTQVVKAKILNQAECLHLCGKENGAKGLIQLSQQVSSGDKGNVEAVAANRYFKELFGIKFRRGDDTDYRNAALNYGYSIFRAIAARSLAAYGFLPYLGIHHCNGLNAFNLADDIMEPFRPVVDLFVATNISDNTPMSSYVKHSLLNLAGNDILVNKKHYAASYALELLVQSLSSFCNGAKSELSLPHLIELQQHSYE